MDKFLHFFGKHSVFVKFIKFGIIPNKKLAFFTEIQHFLIDNSHNSW